MILVLWIALVGIVAAWAAVKPRSRPPPFGARACVLRPCAGVEPALEQALRSSSADTRFAVATEDDPALPVARRVAAEIGAVVVVTGATAPNAKAAQLAAAIVPAPIVVVADSDVVLDGLDAVLAPLSDPRVAAVWAPPIEIAPTTVADRASAAILDTSLHSFALLGALDPGGLVGKLFAIRREDLDRCGGFAALQDFLGEDMELARRLRANGRRIAIASRPALSAASGRSWSAVARRYTRWLLVIRAQRPALLPSYPLLFAPLFPVALAALLEGRPALAALAVAIRLGIGVAARLRASSPRRTFLPVDCVLADVLLWTAFVGALARRAVVWRGRTLRIGAGGRLQRVSQASADSASRNIALSELR